MAKVSKVAEQPHAKHKAAHAGLQQECQSQLGKLFWVQSRKPSFITEDQIYSAQSGSNACESTNDAAQQNWKQCNGSCQIVRVKIKSSALCSNKQREQCYDYVKAELEHSKDGMIQFKAPGAVRGLSFLHVPKATASSAAACESETADVR